MDRNENIMAYVCACASNACQHHGIGISVSLPTCVLSATAMTTTTRAVTQSSVEKVEFSDALQQQQQ